MKEVTLMLAVLALLACSGVTNAVEMVLIPGGEFEMGDHFNEGNHTQRPVHTVSVNSFSMSRYEITNQQYCDYLNSTLSQNLIEVRSGVVYASPGGTNPYCDTTTSSSGSGITWNGSSFGVVSGKANHPMVMVSWYGAVAYCDYYGSRLPTEAEWEYAGRGGEHSPYCRYPWGDSIDGSKANYKYSGDPYDNGTTPIGYYNGSQTPAGVDMANGYGLYDMAGNIWEWCNDWADENYYSISPYDNPQGPASSPFGYRILRGGSWNDGVEQLLCANRGSHPPDGRFVSYGFRVVSAVEPVCGGKIIAWGYNGLGQCTPPVGNDFVAISSGGYQCLALKKDGSLASWGDNTYGQTDDMPPGNDFIAVASGMSHNMALRANGSIVAWGRNQKGQCNVPTGNNFTAIAASDWSSIALKSDGSLTAWGRNDFGECDVPSGNNFTAIAAGGDFGMAIKNDGSLVAWGYNNRGQCNVPAGNDFVSLAGGTYHGLALRTDGSLIAWGYNYYGQLNIPSGNNYVAIAAGAMQSLALNADGSLIAWGDNTYGQSSVPAGQDFVAISTGGYSTEGHGLALTTEPAGPVAYWSFDDVGNPGYDDSGNGNDGVLYGPAIAEGPCGNALSFDGSDDYVEVPDSPELDLVGDFSIALWMNPESYSFEGGQQYSRHIIQKHLLHSNNSGEWATYFKLDGRVEMNNLAPGNYQYFATDSPVSLHQWTHIALIYSQADQTFRMYINGSLDVEYNNVNFDIRDTDRPLRIGMEEGVPEAPFEGRLDEIRIYDRALSESEIEELADACQGPERPEYGEVPDTGQDKLVLLTHGLTNSPDNEHLWVEEIAGRIGEAINPGEWQVHPYKWVEEARKPFWRILAAAKTQGRKVGHDIESQQRSHVHFVAHSAGAALIETASKIIEQKFPDTVIHCTFLDAYVGRGGHMSSKYGKHSVWSDNYFAIDPLPFTQSALSNAHNVDVTWLDPDKDINELGFAMSSHSWPWVFYKDTVPNVQGNWCEGVGNYGFGVSMEAGGWQPEEYPVDNSPKVLCGPFSGPAYQFEMREDSPIDFGTIQYETSDTGMVTITGTSFSLLTGSPVWLSANIEVANPINLIRFEAEFTIGSEGLLSIFWADELLGRIDGRYVLEGMQEYVFELPDTSDPGTYTIVFRVDPYSEVPSEVLICNVSTAYAYIGIVNNYPVADANDNIQISSSEQGYTVIQGTGTDPDGDSLEYCWLEGAQLLCDWTAVGSSDEAYLDLGTLPYFTIGNHTLTLEVSDGQLTATDEMVLTNDNSPPEAQPAPSYQVVEFAIDPIIVVADVADFDGDMLSYEWLKDGFALDSGTVPTLQGGTAVPIPDLLIQPADSLFPVGLHTIELRVSDGVNEPVSAIVSVEVSDTTSPSLSPIPSTTILWPPNHKLVEVTIQANAFDNGGGAITLDVTIESSEPADGDGDGNTEPDWYVDSVDDETGLIELRLRSERSGKGQGRIYTIIITATDGSGNQSAAEVEIRAPHDKRKKK